MPKQSKQTREAKHALEAAVQECARLREELIAVRQNTILLKQQADAKQVQAEAELLRERTKLLSVVGQTMQAFAEMSRWAIGKEQL